MNFIIPWHGDHDDGDGFIERRDDTIEMMMHVAMAWFAIPMRIGSDLRP
jgi:hypothetical protein